MELILCNESETVDNFQYSRLCMSLLCRTKFLMTIHVHCSLVGLNCLNDHSCRHFVGTGRLVNCRGRNVGTLYLFSQCDAKGEGKCKVHPVTGHEGPEGIDA